jgi:[CysO sulfur-carrier protein]-S-L-cysteine hydrolase
MLIASDLLDELVEHARAELPNESCGMIAVDGDRVTRFFPARNEFASPMRFRIDSADQIRIWNAIDELGQDTAIFHSHPNSEASPSQTDINLARDWPGAIWVICSLAADAPVVRGFRIADGAVEEVELVAG